MTELTVVLHSPRGPEGSQCEGRGLLGEVERRIPTDWEVYNMPDWAYCN